MRYGRVSAAGGVQYPDRLQTSGRIGAEGAYSHPALPGVTTVGGALDTLITGEGLYNEVYYGPFALQEGIYVCLGIGMVDLILPNMAMRGTKIEIVGESCLFSLMSAESIQIGNLITSPGKRVESVEIGCFLSLMRTASRWVCSNVFGNVDMEE
jgi:hypothetical protein